MDAVCYNIGIQSQVLVAYPLVNYPIAMENHDLNR